MVVWCNYELQYFASQLIKHYLTKGSQLEVVAKCVDGVRQPCAKLSEIGLDLLYHMEGLLRTTLEQIIEESRCRLIDTIGRTEKVWQPYNLQTKSNLRSVLRELDGLGIDMRSQVTGDTWINLTQSTVNFCRHYMSVCESCALLGRIESLRSHAEQLLADLFQAQYNIRPSPTVTVDVRARLGSSQSKDEINYFFISISFAVEFRVAEQQLLERCPAAGGHEEIRRNQRP